MRRWSATIRAGGIFWEGWTYELCRGPRLWCDLRARLHLYHYPHRAAYIAPVNPNRGGSNGLRD